MVKSPPIFPSSSMENGSSSSSPIRSVHQRLDKGIGRDASIRSYGSEETVEVCCGCRPKAKRRNRKFRKLEVEPSSGKKLWKKSVSSVSRIRNWRYRDALVGDDSEWTAFSQNRDARSIKSSASADDDELFFFDAVEYPLGDGEYPIDGYAVGGQQKFKVVFTTSVQPPANASLSDPESMLRPGSRSSSFGSLSDFEDAYDVVQTDSSHSRDSKIRNHKEPSARFMKIRRRTDEEVKDGLTRPRSSNLEDTIGLAGYPGTLTVEELEECQKFVTKLNNLPSAISEQIYSFRDVEEQAYTICRWVRATKFDADAILKRCVENQPMFEKAKQYQFYGPNLDEHLGCPYSVFLSQYPFLPIGRGKNGSPVNYFKVGHINPEGIMCLVTIDNLVKYFWYSFMYSFKDNIRASREVNPDFCRCEGINVIDLEGLSSSALSQETVEVMKICGKISDFFPETLHCMLVLNAPTIFSLFWKGIKKLIDERTASRIQLISTKEKGQRALEMLIDKKTQIPFDYGGGNITLEEAFLNESNDPDIVKQHTELIHCKRKSRKGLKNTWTLKSDETIEITVYTRSVSKASIEVILNGSVIKSADVQCRFVEEEPGSEETIPHPRKTLVMTSLAGPGEVMVEAKDLDTPVSRSHYSCSRGYFLVVGDVKKQNSRTRTSINSSSAAANGKKPKVSFSFDELPDDYRGGAPLNSLYDQRKRPLHAKVTMTGLSLTGPIKKRKTAMKLKF